MRRRLDDHERVAVHEDVARLGQNRPRACRPCASPGRSGRTAPLYVSATATEPSGSTATPERGAGRGPAPRARRGGRSRTGPCPTAVATSASRTSRSAGRLGVGHHSTPSPTARPEGWAKNAASGGPSRRPSSVVPAQARAVPVAGSHVQSWWLPAIATTTRPSHQARSHGVESSGSGYSWPDPLAELRRRCPPPWRRRRRTAGPGAGRGSRCRPPARRRPGGGAAPAAR
jgi:hypothetical protein